MLKTYTMKKQTKNILYGFILAFATIFSFEVFAQGPGFDEDVEDTPVDGGVTLVLAAAAAYGVKKINDKRKKQGK